LKRLASAKPNPREAFVNMLGNSVNALQQQQQAIQQKIQEAAGTFLDSKKAELDTHVDAELAANDVLKFP
jgi:hypothetical protein